MPISFRSCRDYLDIACEKLRGSVQGALSYGRKPSGADGHFLRHVFMSSALSSVFRHSAQNIEVRRRDQVLQISLVLACIVIGPWFKPGLGHPSTVGMLGL